MTRTKATVLSLLSLLCLLRASTSEVTADPQPPVWPEQFTATLLVNRSGSLAELELAYDWPGGRNLIRIGKQQGNVIWDVEWNNGSSFYIDKQAQTCKTLSMPVGILTPDWLGNATYLGEETVDNIPCHKWTKAKFVDYWADKATGIPVRWTFLWTGAQQEVLSFQEGGTAPEENWQAPQYCFTGSPPVS